MCELSHGSCLTFHSFKISLLVPNTHQASTKRSPNIHFPIHPPSHILVFANDLLSFFFINDLF
jgi:hypothetical protein